MATTSPCHLAARELVQIVQPRLRDRVKREVIQRVKVEPTKQRINGLEESISLIKCAVLQQAPKLSRVRLQETCFYLFIKLPMDMMSRCSSVTLKICLAKRAKPLRPNAGHELGSAVHSSPNNTPKGMASARRHPRRERIAEYQQMPLS
eukprot:4940242-Amphidinium_carterae.1